MTMWSLICSWAFLSLLTYQVCMENVLWVKYSVLAKTQAEGARRYWTHLIQPYIRNWKCSLFSKSVEYSVAWRRKTWVFWNISYLYKSHPKHGLKTIEKHNIRRITSRRAIVVYIILNIKLCFIPRHTVSNHSILVILRKGKVRVLI